MKYVVAITSGDFNGIGPEVALRGALHPAVRRVCEPVLVGPAAAFLYYARRLGIPAEVLELGSNAHGRSAKRPHTVLSCVESSVIERGSIAPGRVSVLAGRAAARAIETAVRLACMGAVDAVVTAPVSKRAMHMAGVRFPGQTEMVQKLSGAETVAMMLACSTLRVGLVTIHLPLKKVPAQITPALVEERIRVIHEALRRDWGVRHPRLAVLGLNPHAGEDGDLGTEERRVIIPVVRALQRRGLRLAGPFPADAFFARYAPGTYDAVVAMYHDQGLIPLKMLAHGKGVNVSLGLPVVRTSPDHGTAFDIAGTGEADASSMVEAIRLAVRLAKNRRSHSRKSP
jgi:4-hydroxythreonine-4-phosphate dehydrogenase